MDFFQHQDAARRKTGRLVACFALAVVLIVAAVYFAVLLVFRGFNGELERVHGGAWWLWQPELLMASGGGALALIGSGSAYKTMMLSSGGEAVARTLGGRLIQRNTTDADERMVLNVVDEMAIASGVPSPPVYLLENESGINAFAAGFSTDDAVIGVTRGTIEQLSRDELQGVIAHEFSHILNGDMRLNLRLMGLLHGILLLALVGYWILRSGSFRSRRRSKGNGAGAVLAIGLALLVIGYIGVFFAKLIKSAVSRQREFLADAAAVQFTRNPDGIGGALKKIGGWSSGSKIKHSQAEQASHLFFGNALKSSFFNLFSTHPPLDERIRRLDPSFAKQVEEGARPPGVARDIGPAAAFAGEHLPAGAASAGSAWEARTAFQPQEAIRRVGRPTPGDVAQAARLRAQLPEKLVELADETFGARIVIFGLLLERDAALRGRQIERLAKSAEPALLSELERHQPLFDGLPPEARLPLVELALPALRELSLEQYRAFRDKLHALIQADARVNLFEFVLSRMVLLYLEPHFRKTPRRPRTRYLSLPTVQRFGGDLLSAVAHAGHRDRDQAARAFGKAAPALGVKANELRLRADSLNEDILQAADRALRELATTSPKVRQRVLSACASCIEADGVTTVEEAQLLRVIAESLNCPLPPDAERAPVHERAD
ncbi:MAG: M48 family metallopeptidase [Planctomycetes bacterium]|nr:M48 family metallopeptidase [Planctomycetota bacterium]